MSTLSEVIPVSELVILDASYTAFKVGFITLNGLVRNEEVTALDGIKCGIDNGDTIGTYFPHPRDKDSLLQLAFELSKEHEEPIGAAMQLGAAVPVIHPSLDGNGRTSRAIHASILGIPDAEIARLEVARPHTDEDWGASLRGRALIDLKPPAGFRQAIVDKIIFRTSKVPHVPYITAVSFTDDERDLYDATMADCTSELREDLETLFKIYPKGEKRLNELHRDHESLAFALNAVKQAGANVVIDQGKLANFSNDYFTPIDMPQTLHELGNDGRTELVNEAWRYRRMAAEVTIHCLSARGLGQRVLGSTKPPMTIAEYYKQSTSNLADAIPYTHQF